MIICLLHYTEGIISTTAQKKKKKKNNNPAKTNSTFHTLSHVPLYSQSTHDVTHDEVRDKYENGS